MHNRIIYFDAETTGTNPYTCEIIEANFQLYIDGVKKDEYDLKLQVREWCYEAQKIHKITKKDMLKHDDKVIGFKKFLDWLPADFAFCTYANLNTELGVINFDVACLENELDLIDYGNYFLKNNFGMKAPFSCHTLARKLGSSLAFTPNKKKSESGRMMPDYTQEGVYKALFGKSFKGSHRAKNDTDALVKIHHRLLELSNETRTLL